jgi:hypothetical protein
MAEEYSDIENCHSLDFVDYWLKSIRSKAPNSIVLLVGTHADMNVVRELPLDSFENFGQILKSFKVSCINGIGMNELREELIKLAINKQLQVPKTYLTLGNYLSEFSDKIGEFGQPFIERNQLVEIAKSIGIIEEEQLKAAISVLHNLGYLLYYPPIDSSQKDIIILKPQWLVDVFKSVVTMNSKKANLIQNGWLYHISLPLLWPEINDSTIHFFLLGILEKFKITIKSKGEKSLVPCRLDFVPKVFKEDKKYGKLLRKIKFRDILPLDVFPTFLASPKVYPFLSNDLSNIWKDCVILYEDSDEKQSIANMVRCRSDSIEIIGHQPSEMIATVTDIIKISMKKNWPGN